MNEDKTDYEHEHEAFESARYEPEEEGLGVFDKLLPLWIVICIIVGILLSQYVPGLSEAIESYQFAGMSIPIAIYLIVMMYPAMLNVKGSELKKVGKHPKPIILTLFSNWVVAPFVGLMTAIIFVPGNSQLVLAIILLHASPCTAMVLVWGWMAKGSQEQNVIITSINTVTIILLYVPMVMLLVFIANITLPKPIPLDSATLLVALSVFIGLPLIAGVLSKKYLTQAKGEKWFDHKFRPAVSKVAIVALLMTLLTIFSLNGQVLLRYPDVLLRVSVPVLVGVLTVLIYNVVITRIFKMRYRRAVITVVVGSSSHFEIAIAVAVAMYGIGSYAALGTTMGLFWEIPVMLSVVYFSRYLGRRGFWKGYEEAIDKGMVLKTK
ncbi:MAG: arsenic resistance protein [Promethearchaeia archaeon]